MQRQVVNSSRINSVGFDEQSSTMEIEFHGGGRVYQYTGPKVKEHYDAIMAAHENGESVGRYFNQHVRNCPDTSYCEVKS